MAAVFPKTAATAKTNKMKTLTAALLLSLALTANAAISEHEARSYI